MDRTEAARRLRVAEATLERWVRQGLMRSKDRDGLQFELDELVRWAKARGMQIDAEPDGDAGASESPLVAAIERGSVTSAAPATAADAIALAIDALGLPAGHRKRALDAVLDRERMASTALERGIAVPHPREPLGDLVEDPRMSVVFLEQPLDWAAPDGEPVHSVVLLLAPTSSAHLETLSALGRALRAPELHALLSTRPKREELLEALRAVATGAGP